MEQVATVEKGSKTFCWEREGKRIKACFVCLDVRGVGNGSSQQNMQS